MSKIHRVIPITLTFFLSFLTLAFGEQVEKEILLTNASNARLYSLWTLKQRTEPASSFPEEARSGNAIHDISLINTFEGKETLITLGIPDILESFRITDIQRNAPLILEEGQISKGRSRYHWEEIHMTKGISHSPSNIIPSLLVGQYKEENSPPCALDGAQNTPIFNPLAILLALKLVF
jgi:hypothetical protein